jgi:hypothetical protein
VACSAMSQPDLADQPLSPTLMAIVAVIGISIFVFVLNLETWLSRAERPSVPPEPLNPQPATSRITADALQTHDLRSSRRRHAGRVPTLHEEDEDE